MRKSLFRAAGKPLSWRKTCFSTVRNSLFRHAGEPFLHIGNVRTGWLYIFFRLLFTFQPPRHSVSIIPAVKIFYFPFCIFIRFHIRTVFMPCKRTVRTEATYVILWEDKNIQGQIVLYDIKCLYLQPDFVWLRTYNHINLIVTAMWNRHRTDAVNGEAHYYI